MKLCAKYDFLIVGGGMYGASAARELTDRGRRVLVVEKRDHVGGNAYTEDIDGICVHMYGPHIFHTDSVRVWEFVNRFARFNGFINQPLADYHGELYSLPFNMNTFRELWGVTDPGEARKMIRQQSEAVRAGLERRTDPESMSAGPDPEEPVSLEEQAISLVGTDLYEKLIRGYTEKQWGRPCSELPASIIRRVPVRYEYNNDYFDDRYQGIPEGGYTAMIEAMLEGIDVLTGVDFLGSDVRSELSGMADRIIYTGQIDAYYGYCLGPLGYRGLRFETESLMMRGYYQPRAVVNYTDGETPWTRIIEHRHFTEDVPGYDPDEEPEGGAERVTVVTREYPAEWHPGDEAFYPVNDSANQELYDRYLSLAAADEGIIFGGRLGSYKYYDMDDAIEAALEMAEELCGGHHNSYRQYDSQEEEG